MVDNRRHPGEMNLAVWMPEELHAVFMAKCKRLRVTARSVIMRFCETWTGYQKPEVMDGTQNDQESKHE